METDESDSGVDMEMISDMESITSSNYEFRHHGHRRYHGIEGNQYPLPNDEEELRRLDDLHLMYRCHLGRNILAPITSHPTTIIDLGTGSGLWPIEVATRYPDCAVTGVDLSPVNPLYEIPENCDFIVADVNDGLTWPEGSVDLVHSRVIMAGLKQAAWAGYMAEIMRVLKPGTGWAQCTEFRGCHLFSDGNKVPPDSALREFETYLAELIAEIGIYWNGEHVEQDFKNAGFIDIQTKYVVLEMGNWRGDTSRKLRDGRDAAERVHTGAFLALIDHMKEKHYPDDEERQRFKERVKADITNHEYRLWFDSYTVIGRKPPAPL